MQGTERVSARPTRFMKWGLLAVLLIAALVAVSVRIAADARKIRDEDEVIRSVAKILGAPVVVGRWEGIGPFRHIDYVRLPRVPMGKVREVGNSLRELSHLDAVFIQDAELDDASKKVLRTTLTGVLLADGFTTESGVIQWESMGP